MRAAGLRPHDGAVLAQIHPLLVHFAVALLLMAPACDALGMVLRREALLHAGRWNTLFGAGAAVLAVLSGLGAETAVDQGGAGLPLLQLHKALGFLLAGVWIPVAIWRVAVSRVALPLRLRTVYLTASFVGAAMVLAQAGLGSALVYRHGVGLSTSARMPPPAPRVAPPSAQRTQ